MPPKKKASGDPAKGEKIFKNLCSACHALSVGFKFTFHLFYLSYFRLTQLAQL